jgi:Tol biopolymer transport system component
MRYKLVTSLSCACNKRQVTFEHYNQIFQETSMKITRTQAILLLFTILLSSCATLEVGIETTSVNNQAAIETTVAEFTQATLQAGENQPTEVLNNSGEPTVTPTIESQPIASSPYAGLIYRLGDQLFQVGPDGQTLSLAPSLDPQMLPGQFTPRVAVSPDGEQMISWWDWSDLWLVDLTSGEARNLTNTLESQECCAQFWPERSDTIIFLTRMTDADGLSYKMAAVNLDSSNFHLLDESASPLGLPALSPDGHTIAYDPAGRSWLYRWDSGPEAFNPADYGLQTSPENYGLTNPSWSPTGKYITWMVSGDPTGSGIPQGSAIVFDLEGRTYRILHPFEPVGSEAGFLPAMWSPYGNWLAVFDLSFEQSGVWVMHLDGSGQMLAYSPGTVRSVFGLQVLWSPDAQRLLVVDPNAEGDIRLTLLNLLTNQIEPSPIPAGAIPLAWVK